LRAVSIAACAAAVGLMPPAFVITLVRPSATNGKRLVQLAAPSATVALEAILTLLPIDASATPPAMTMKVPGDVAELLEPTREFAAALARADPPVAAVGLERNDFYARARNAFAVVRTAELRRFANIILVKGVVNRYPPA
jgi:L-fucose mutarotase